MHVTVKLADHAAVNREIKDSATTREHNKPCQFLDVCKTKLPYSKKLWRSKSLAKSLSFSCAYQIEINAMLPFR